jgi:hypothetical protein
MRLPVCEPFALRAFHGRHGAGLIIKSERDAIAVTKIELAQIAVQMLFAAMLINALHAALENAVVALQPCLCARRRVHIHRPYG